MPPKPKVVAVDTNILLDIAVPKDAATDAVDLMREHMPGCAFIVLPTVILELRYLSIKGDAEVRMLATRALHQMRAWGFQPVNYIPAGHAITERIADKMRAQGLLPEEERNDSFIVAEAALALCEMIISSDHHMLEIPKAKLHALLDAHDVGCLEIVSPSDMLKKFS
ncbi:rRNA-processing protein FCF1 [Ereboglobus sp. PH5-5]|uniref:type II toxin-antitoxin system VapC family toxin n=1 Tax=unclassified Ereboglobus TaxID=2626932 RepID=UPI0024058BFD|nr:MULTISPECIES: type II toxin-antitoxin system VapC family toxin [unclassified Ereboglobus]MDF9825925.1 rRNA-processing protein FCF1 [Ereboglobus sp. PH5-10]MDF9833314.1 rRNA-processing protein FCF1 [Ereboglobus sp. PH5-5]